MILPENSLIQRLEPSRRVERVVRVEGDDVATIDAESPKVRYRWYKLEQIREDLDAHKAIILEVDKWAPPPLTESELEEHHPKLKEKRDKALYIIGPLIKGENARRILFRGEHFRLVGQRVAELEAENRARREAGQEEIKGVTRQSIDHLLKRWLQRGQTPNALLSDYLNCGGRGKERSDGELEKDAVKRGRPSLITKDDENKTGVKRPTGINVDKKARDIIIAGGIMFYEHRNVSFAEAYSKTLERFCATSSEENGVKKYKIPDSARNEVFTEGQFKYHYEKFKNRDLRRALISRLGERRYNHKYRELKGRIATRANRPGAIYQIDATLADVYLVSPLNSLHIIGRPILWLIIDVFSRMIVGFSVRFEGEGWLGLMLALKNVTEDKVEFCAKYGFDITSDLWLPSFLPEELMGDRGALESRFADKLSEGLNITITNTAPYRGDLKGTIEQLFNQMNLRLIHGLPGCVAWQRVRGEADYRLAAALNLDDFVGAVIAAILYHNNQHRMDGYFAEMDDEMLADDVQPYPSKIFQWGIENRSGHLRKRDAETIRINLLAEEEATITDRGIKVGPYLYTCDEAEAQQWYLKADITSRWKTTALKDLRTTKMVWLRLGDGTPSIPCYRRDDSPTKCADWAETDHYVDKYKVASKRAETTGLQAKSDFKAEVKRFVDRGLKRKQEALANAPEQSKASLLRNIRSNRKDEIDRMQRAEEQELLAQHGYPLASQASTPSLTSGADKSDEDYVPFPEPTDIVRSIRERMMDNAQEER